MSLLGLPNELVLMILDFTLPESIETATILCKRLYGLGKPLLQKHRTFRAQFHSIAIAENEGCFHPLQLIDLVLDQPDVALYVKKMSYLPRVDTWFPKDIKPEESRRTSLGFPSHYNHDAWEGRKKETLRRLVQRSGYLTASGFSTEEHLDDMLSGNPAASFAVMLTMLPFLHTLRVSETTGTTDERYFKPLLNYIHDYRRGRPILERLTTIETACHSETRESPENLQTLAQWSILPSVRTLKGVAIGDDGSSWPYGGRQSMAENVEILYGHTQSNSWDSLITNMPNLREFSYQASPGWMMDQSEGWDVSALVNALKKHRVAGLEKMSITFEPFGGDYFFTKGPIPCLKSFTHLKTLEVDSYLLMDRTGHGLRDIESMLDDDSDYEIYQNFGLLKERKAKVPKLLDILPSSLQKLRMSFTGDANSQCKKLFRGFANHFACKKALPNLTRIELSCEPDEFPNDIRDEIEQAGVSIGFIIPDGDWSGISGYGIAEHGLNWEESEWGQYKIRRSNMTVSG